MNSYIMHFVTFTTIFSICTASSTCSSNSVNVGRDLATKEFKKWDKNCTTLESFYQKILKNEP